VKKRLSIWYQANQLGNVDQMDRDAKNHNWVALPLRLVIVDGPPFSVSASGIRQANTAQRGRFQVTFPCAVSRDKELGTS